MENTLFCRKISVGDAIRPYLVAGVLEKEYNGSRDGGEMIKFRESAIFEAVEKFKDTSFKEFDSFEFFGMTGKWKMIDTPAPRYAGGTYKVMERLGLMPIYVELESEIDQTVKVRTGERRIVAVLNGEIAYDSKNPELRFPKDKDRVYKRVFVYEHNVNPNYELMTFNLKKGTNRLLMLTGHVGRGTGIQFDMSLESAEAPIYAVAPISLAEESRKESYESFLKTHMTDDLYSGDDVPTLKIGNWPLKYCTVKCAVNGPSGMKFTDLEIDANGVCKVPGAVQNGGYATYVYWYLEDGTLIGDKRMTFSFTRFIDPMPGHENFDARRRFALDTLASRENSLALYRLGRAGEINAEKIFATCDKIEKRADCADFELLPLLWLMWEDRNANRIAKEIKERVKKAALSFRYWVDEPESSSMFYCSENHRIGFHVCEYLAGLLYPRDMFTCAEQNGMFHCLKGRMHLVEWLSQRCKFGFDEPHSSAYFGVTLSAILCLREVLPMDEYPLRNMVNVLLDFMTFILASANLDGYFATPQGRGYTDTVRNGFGNTFMWIMFGNAKTKEWFNQELAFSTYVPPKGICDVAYNVEPTTFRFKQGLMHFDKHNADFTIRRTPDYAIGGVRDHNVGMCDMHFFTDMIFLKGDIPIFFQAPNNAHEGSGQRPDYWAGQAFLPRVIMEGRTMAVIWHNVNNPIIWMTHCHFNRRKFDEVVQKNGWTFGRKDNGYVAIWSSVPHSFREEGVYSDRELIADGNETVWLAECGSKAEDGSFEGFMDKILKAELTLEGEKVTFASPGSGLWEFGLTDGFDIDGKSVPISDYLIDCPYLKSKFGSGKFEYSCGDFNVTQWSYPASV